MPPFLRIPRPEFDAQLLLRERNFIKKLKEQLGHIDNNISIVRRGDWHYNGCSLVLDGLDGIIVIKQRNPQAELLMGKILNGLNEKTGSRCYVPEITEYNNFFTQEYVVPVKPNKKHSRDFGATAAACLALGTYDLHKDNIIIAENGIALIDCDCSFYSKAGISYKHFLRKTGLMYRNRSAQ